MIKTKSLRPAFNAPTEHKLFFKALEASGLLAPASLEQLKQRFLQDGIDAVADLAIENDWLTPYQIQRILDGEVQGLILGQYRILDELGKGGFGQVFKAVHTMMDRITALKVIAPGLLLDRKVRSLFLREVLATTRLVHPNIAFAYDANEINGVLFLALEYIEGLNLEQYLVVNGVLPEALACAYMLQTAQALQFAHERGMVHRDIKPANILLPGTNQNLNATNGPPVVGSPLVKVVDFGLARLFPAGASQTMTIEHHGRTLGTPAFMSPEQARDFHEVDTRSDLYSLGCTFYYALTGQIPFEGGSVTETFAMHMEKAPEPILRLRPDLSPNVAGIIHRLMSKKPEHRYQTPAALVEELSYTLRVGWLQDASTLPNRLKDGEREKRNSADKSPQADSKSVDENGPPVAEYDEVASGQGVNDRQCSNSSGKYRFPELFYEWCAVLRGQLDTKSPSIDEAYYKTLHRLLLTTKHDQIDLAPDAHELRDRARQLVEPWLSARSLVNLDQAILSSLWNECRPILEKLAPPRKQKASPWGMIATVCFFLIVFSAPFLFRWLPTGVVNSLSKTFAEKQSIMIAAAVGLVPILGLAVLFQFRKKA